MNPSSKIKLEIEDKLGINLKESSIKNKENLNEAGEAFNELKTYNAVQMASLERIKIDSEEIKLKVKPDYYYYPIEHLNKDFSQAKKAHLFIYVYIV